MTAAPVVMTGGDDSGDEEEQMPAERQLRLVMSDEFDGTELNREVWTVLGDSGRPDDGCPDLCGFGNNELQVYSSSSISVSSGVLTITARTVGDLSGRSTFVRGDFISARIHTRYRWNIRYGRIEASVKLPAGLGTWPAVWMLPTNEFYGTWPQSGEIDIVEATNLGDNDKREIFGTLHFGRPWPQNSHISATHTPSEQPADDFHLYAVEWDEAGEIRFYYDNVHYATRTMAEWFTYVYNEQRVLVRVDGTAPFDRDFYILINLAIGGNFPGFAVDTAVFPVQMQVDYVRVYQFVE